MHQHRQPRRLILGLVTSAALLTISSTPALAEDPDARDPEPAREASARDRDRGSSARPSTSEAPERSTTRRAEGDAGGEMSDLDGHAHGRVDFCHPTDDGSVRITLAEDAVRADARLGDGVGVIGGCAGEEDADGQTTLGVDLASTDMGHGSGTSGVTAAVHPEVLVYGPWLILLAALGGGETAIIERSDSPASSVSAGAESATSAAAASPGSPMIDPLAIGADALVATSWDGTALALERLEAARPVAGNIGSQTQVFPAEAGNMGFVDAAVGSLLSLSCLALAGVFGSRWLTARRR